MVIFLSVQYVGSRPVVCKAWNKVVFVAFACRPNLPWVAVDLLCVSLRRVNLPRAGVEVGCDTVMVPFVVARLGRLSAVGSDLVVVYFVRVRGAGFPGYFFIFEVLFRVLRLCVGNVVCFFLHL